MKQKICFVHWKDASSKDEWTSEIIKTSSIVSVGFLVSETDSEIVLAGDVDETNANFSRQMCIPKKMIESIDHLRRQVKKVKRTVEPKEIK